MGDVCVVMCRQRRNWDLNECVIAFLFAKVYDRPDLVCVCVSLASDSSETVEVIIVNLGFVTASITGMHLMLSILTLTFVQGHTDQIH